MNRRDALKTMAALPLVAAGVAQAKEPVQEMYVEGHVVVVLPRVDPATRTIADYDFDYYTARVSVTGEGPAVELFTGALKKHPDAVGVSVRLEDTSYKWTRVNGAFQVHIDKIKGNWEIETPPHRTTKA